ncbi:serine/threonine-protein kinase Warts-like [Bradysia coprophila]|uniref:serine/threonine-protein kinase Warts-like n=1 Tax=Bradysia coprophila TaxID=38358 RepID=UPI00187DC296|nr:serine/threonine-protein kinase Warts-like [Bradysia coprophila]
MQQQVHSNRLEVQPPSLPPRQNRKCDLDINLHQRIAESSPVNGDTVPPPLPPRAIPRASPDVLNDQRVIVYQNGASSVHDFTAHMQALSLYQSETTPPPYPIQTLSSSRPPSYAAHIQSRQSPCQSHSDYRKSPSSGIYSATSSPSPITISQHSLSPYQLPARPPPIPDVQRWQQNQQQNIVMQSVKSIQVQKPVLQTALAPPPPPPSYASSIQSKIQRTGSPLIVKPQNIATRNDSPGSVKASSNPGFSSVASQVQNVKDQPEPAKQSQNVPKNESNTTATATNTTETTIKHQSPIPQRKQISKEKEDERKALRIRQYSPQAFKFYMEQHVENVLKSYKQRMFRRKQLEREMSKINLSEEAQVQLRKMLNQKESNYIRLKRAKMDKSMFMKVEHIGVGAFGEVTLVRKIDATNHLYAMKTLRKSDVLKRNQMAHIKAERDILAEADNEWVVKLYYSFQDNDNLYFVMDYIPGGDLMNLLIKMEIFDEPFARFYIAELTCAIESVHKMGFIHRDIKPDNVLIDADGHIKLTDFGLCTGFRWTHDSKYYQKTGHARQHSMEPWETEDGNNKPTVLERRRQRERQRYLAHSLVGTPNFIAPEVLERSGYTQLCDWWSVGVILYEMLVGKTPFLANTAAETQLKVINYRKTLHIPAAANLSENATDLILRLCTSPDRRLGKNGSGEVKAHPFFNEIDFSLDLRQQKAPYIPKIAHPLDTSNFDTIDPDQLHNSSSNSFDFSNDPEKPLHGFYEFTFRRFFTDDKIFMDMDEDTKQNTMNV